MCSKKTAYDSIVTQADIHYTIALSKASTAISMINETSCHAIYASSVFICFCSLAKGPQAGQYLGFSDNGNAEWLGLLGGVRSVIQHSQDALSVDLESHKVTNPSLHQRLREISENKQSPCSGWNNCLKQLRELLMQDMTVTCPRYEIYLGVLDGLDYLFDKAFGEKTLSRGEKWAQTFRWLYTLPELFDTDLQEKKYLALLFFSPFIVLLKELESYWFVQGWPEHIMSGVYRYLNVQQRESIRWQMEQVGFTPSDALNKL